MPDLVIRGGRVLDPARKLDGPADVVIEGDRIAAVGPHAGGSSAGAGGEDARGELVVPGLIDMHVHLREPGNEEEETIASGAAAALAGGFTSVCCMPNTDPALDNEAAIAFVYLQAERARQANVFPIGAITLGREGKVLTELGRLARAGAVAVSDDGVAVRDARLLADALRFARELGFPVIEHCEDLDLRGAGVVHDGIVAARLGLPGVPAEAEEIIVERDVRLAAMTGGRLHVAHVSTAGAVEIIRQAKARGVAVTAEVTPHHLLLTEEAVAEFDPRFKMSPPLRTAHDAAALLAGLADGTLDAVASDHAPHTAEEKGVEFDAAPDGAIGLEATLGVLLTGLVRAGKLPLATLIRRLTAGPAGILGLGGRGTLAPGAPADVTVIDLERAWTLDPEEFRSKSRNCPFAGWKLTGKAVATVVGGRLVEG